MNKVFTKNGWEDYIYWQTEDKKTLKKINKLIEDICRIGWSIRLMKKMSILFHADTIIREWQ